MSGSATADATGATRARQLLAALDEATTLPTLTGADPSFDLAQAFAVADEIRRLRIARGEVPLGYKIGFTNRGIWARYGVFAPIWGPVWNTTVERVDSARTIVSLAPFVAPRLEPEIMFGFAKAPAAGMSLGEVAACIDWVAHGFEIVHTRFSGWRFAAADTVADFALHALPLVVEDVGGHARQRSGKRGRPQLGDHVAAEDAAGDLGPAGVVDYWQPAAADLLEVPLERFWVPGFAGAAQLANAPERHAPGGDDAGDEALARRARRRP